MTQERRTRTGLSYKERMSVRERDFRYGKTDNKTPGCQFCHDAPEAHGILCQGNLEVHHILPVRFSTVWLKAVEAEINTAINTLTVCESAHVRSPKGIHVDQAEAYRIYGEDKQSFEKMFKERNVLAEQGIPYWNTVFDGRLAIQARKNNQMARDHGWQFGRHSRQFETLWKKMRTPKPETDGMNKELL